MPQRYTGGPRTPSTPWSGAERSEREQWQLDLDEGGRVDADAAPVTAMPDDGMVRIYDADGDLVVDAIETTDERRGT